MAEVGTEPLVDLDEVVAIVRELAQLPGAAGAERDRAERLAALLAARARAAGALVTVDAFGEGRRANVVVGPPDGADVALVGHLDTSLGDDPEDWRRLTGRAEHPGAVAVRDGALEGLGVGVALAPSVTAALAAIELHRRRSRRGRTGTVGALITAGGTHRAAPPITGTGTAVQASAPASSAAGLREAARRGRLPRAAVNAKGGAPGPLHVEPGSLYLSLELTTAWGPVLALPVGPSPIGGPAGLGSLIDAVAAWRRRFLAARADEDVIGVDVAIGAVHAGLPSKPDLLPAVTTVHVHVVTAPGDEPDGLARSLEHAVRESIGSGRGEVVVRPYGWLPAGRTDPAHPLVRAADDAWRRLIGPHDVRGWRGATDGAYLRHLGIPTVRIGPPLSNDPADGRRERVRLDDLAIVAEVWSQTVACYLDGEAAR